MRSLIAFFLMGFIFTAADAADSVVINNSIVSKNYNIDNNTIVSENVSLNLTNLNIRNSIYLENNGYISANLNVYDGYKLEIQNSGYLSGNIYTGNKSSVIQVIENSKDINKLNFVGDSFYISVRDRNLPNLLDVINISGNATKISLDNASVLLDVRNFNVLNNQIIISPNIELIGDVFLKLKNFDNLSDKIILSNVSGNGFMNVNLLNNDSLYTVYTVRDNDKIYITQSRETDYQKILGMRKGSFANSLRYSSNKTIIAMDRAGSISDLYSVMDKSVFFNPINLMRPIRLFNEFENNKFSEIKNRRERESFSLGMEPIYIFSNGMYLSAGKITFTNTTRNFLFSISANAGNFKVSDDINDFSGNFYGAATRLRFDNKYMWFDTKFGYTKSDFDIGAVMDSESQVYNPTGNMFYGILNTGIKLKYNGFYLSPYIGAGSSQESVAHQYDSSVYGNIGSIFGFNVSQMGLVYRYSAFIDTQTNNVSDAGIKMEIWSIDDGAGGDITYQIIKDEIGISNKISTNLKFSF